MAELHCRPAPVGPMCRAQFPDVLRAVRGARYPAIFEVTWALREIEVCVTDAESLGTSLDASVVSASGCSPAASGRVSFECAGAERVEALVAQLLEAFSGPKTASSSPERRLHASSHQPSLGTKEKKQPTWGWNSCVTAQSHNGPSLLESQRGREEPEWPCFGHKENCESVEQGKPASVHSSSPPQDFSLSMEMAWEPGPIHPPAAQTTVVSRPALPSELVSRVAEPTARLTSEPMVMAPSEPAAPIPPTNSLTSDNYMEAHASYTSPRLDTPPWTLPSPGLLPEYGVEPRAKLTTFESDAASWTLSGFSETDGNDKTGQSCDIDQNCREERVQLAFVESATTSWTSPKRRLGDATGKEACAPQGLGCTLGVSSSGARIEPVVEPVEPVNTNSEATNGRLDPCSACTQGTPHRRLRPISPYGAGCAELSPAIPTLLPMGEGFLQHPASNGTPLNAEAAPSGRGKLEELRKRYGLSPQSHHPSVPQNDFSGRPRHPSPLVRSNTVEGALTGGAAGGAVSSGCSREGSSAGGTPAASEQKWTSKWAESPTISRIEAFRRDVLTGTPRDRAHLGAEGSKTQGPSPFTCSAGTSPAYGLTEPIAATSIGGTAATAAAATARQESPAARPQSSVLVSPRLGFSPAGGATKGGADVETNHEPCDSWLRGTGFKEVSRHSSGGSGIKGLLGTGASKPETVPINDRFRQMLRGRGLDGDILPARPEGIPSARCVELH